MIYVDEKKLNELDTLGIWGLKAIAEGAVTPVFLEGKSDLLLCEMILKRSRVGVEDILKVYEEREEEYGQIIEKHILPIDRLLINTVSCFMVGGVYALLGIYLESKVTGDTRLLKSILKRRYKKEYKYIENDENMVDSNALKRFIPSDIGRKSPVVVFQYVMVWDLICHVNGKNLIAEWELDKLDDMLETLHYARITNTSLSDEDVWVIQGSSLFNAICYDGARVDESSPIKQWELSGRTEEETEANKVNKRLLGKLLNACEISHKEVYVWNDLIPDDCKGGIHNYVINTCIYGYDLIYEEYQEDLLFIVLDRLRLVYKEALEELDILTLLNLIFSSLEIYKLGKERELLSHKAYVNLKSDYLKLKEQMEQEYAEKMEKLNGDRLRAEQREAGRACQIESLSDEVKAQRKEIERLTEQLECAENDRVELEMYRRHNHLIQEEVSGESLEEKIDYCRQQDVLILGGNPEWQRAIKEVLPQVSLYGLDEISRYRSKLAEVDKVWVNITYAGHTSYYKLMNVLSVIGVKADYLSGFTNLDRQIDEMYRSLRK